MQLNTFVYGHADCILTKVFLGSNVLGIGWLGQNGWLMLTHENHYWR